jgi:hypothetical protein
MSDVLTFPAFPTNVTVEEFDKFDAAFGVVIKLS